MYVESTSALPMWRHQRNRRVVSTYLLSRPSTCLARFSSFTSLPENNHKNYEYDIRNGLNPKHAPQRLDVHPVVIRLVAAGSGSTWASHPSKNCYNRRGATDITGSLGSMVLLV